MSNESTNIIETMSAELEHLRPMEASLEMAEADVKAYKQRIVVLEKEVERLKNEADKVIARYKYKHCLDMAYKCVKLCQKSKDLYRWAEDENLEHYYNHKIEFFARWHNRWLELAEKFKEAK